jgi:hypothetical protein
MIFVDMVFSSIRLSRLLDIDEEMQLESIRQIQANQVTLIGNEVAPLQNTSLIESSYWKVDDVRLVLEGPDKYHFFLESLIWLIHNFFIPKNVILNGYVFGVDHLFGSFHCYYVYGNRVFILPDMITYFDNLCLSPDIHINLSLISKHMEELVNKSYIA